MGRKQIRQARYCLWNSLQKRLEILDLVMKGVKDLREGRVISQQDAKARLARFAR